MPFASVESTASRHIQHSTDLLTPSSSIIQPTMFVGSPLPSTVDSRNLLLDRFLVRDLQQSLIQQQQVALEEVHPLQVHQSRTLPLLDSANLYTDTDRIQQAIEQGIYKSYLDNRILRLQAQDLSFRQSDAVTLERMSMEPPTSYHWVGDQGAFERRLACNNREPSESDMEDAAFALSALARGHHGIANEP